MRPAEIGVSPVFAPEARVKLFRDIDTAHGIKMYAEWAPKTTEFFRRSKRMVDEIES